MNAEINNVNQSQPNEVASLTNLSRFSLNQITTNSWTLRQAVEGCLRHNVGAIGLWRDKVEETGLRESARLIRDAGLRVSSLCRGGFFPAATPAERRARIEDNRRAIAEAAELGAPVLVLVPGGLAAGSKDIAEARRMIADGIAEILADAQAANVKLGIEPLHPMFAADRSVVATLGEANDLAERFDADTVGVIVDVFHVWWDAAVNREIARAGKRILGFHVSDWAVPLPDVLLGRAMMGDGVIELQKLRAAAEAAGYTDLIEIEIFNRKIWDGDADETLAQCGSRYLEYV